MNEHFLAMTRIQGFIIKLRDYGRLYVPYHFFTSYGFVTEFVN